MVNRELQQREVTKFSNNNTRCYLFNNICRKTIEWAHGRMMTGSASKGYSADYNYYHCQAKCKTRFKAEITNEQFLEILDGFKITPEAREVNEMN